MNGQIRLPQLLRYTRTSTARLSRTMSRLSRPLPANTIDTHCHIIPPDFTKYPLVSTAEYKPSPHTVSDAEAYYQRFGQTLPMVLTQVSIYGHDNSALLSGLSELNGRGRGVVEFDPKTVSTDQLDSWWSKGVRGARINLVSVSKSVSQDELRELLQSYVDVLVSAPQSGKWVVDLFIPFSSVKALAAVIGDVRGSDQVRFCLAHFAGLKLAQKKDVREIDGMKELVGMMKEREVYVKLSGAYRVDKAYPSNEAKERLDAIGRELVQVEDKVMWASDWPHTRFEGTDSLPLVEWCYDWCGPGADGERRIEKLFRGNAAKVWDL